MINCIVAVEKNQGIGIRGSLPWPHLHQDMKFFKNKTTNNCIIMGRKTWESIGSKPLLNRINVVCTRGNVSGADHYSHNLDNLLDYCKINYPDKEIFVIGGGAIYDYFFSKVDKFYITEINAEFNCDTFFNLDSVKQKFSTVKILFEYQDPIPFTIKEYSR
jgi:dihydrofolate reductase